MKPFYFRIIAVAGLLSLACTTKVSEWVLLNVKPGQYTLVYFHNDPVSDKTKQKNDGILKNISEANIEFREAERKDIEKPYYALYYGKRCFSSYNDPAELKNLVSSPVRDTIAGELKKGKLCAIVYLESGSKDRDDKGMTEIKKAISSSPFGSIVTVIGLDRNSIAEYHFVSMLLNVESDLKSIDEPMVFGVFGRFKALEPLVGGGITAENINLMLDFLTADCSCLIKDNLPGTDILYTNSWESPRTALVNQILDANPSLLH